jgi:hypothetical protein
MATASVAKNQNPVQMESPLDKMLRSFGEKIYERDSRNRFAEDREWYQQALVYQMKQWNRLNSSGKWEQIPQDPKKPVPMPVSDYFSKTINANANSLGAAIPEIEATPDDTDTVNRRAAEAAESIMEELDKETGMDVLNPILAKHTTLWGMGCVKDTVDTSLATGVSQIPGMDMQTSNVNVCQSCGYMAIGQQPQQPSLPTMEPPAPQAPCPQCNAPMSTENLMEPQAGDMQSFPKGKLNSEVVKIFEIYLPRDCRDANLTPILTHRFRRSKNKAKSLFPDAGELPTDSSRDIPQYYADALQSLVMSGQEHSDLVTFTEIWSDWAELDEDVQEAIEAEWQSEPSQVIGYEQLSKFQAAQQYGIYFIFVNGKTLAKSENPWDGKKCFTFFPWEKDPASPYPIGQGARLVPLQKQLNRLDSLMELSAMTNSVGKWIIPRTQVGSMTPITGSPHDHIYFDNQGDGKVAPHFVLPNPYGPALPARRQQILSDFDRLGYTEGVGTGDAPSGVKSFRGIAYLGAKQEESIGTQRFLWEQAHTLRKEKLLIMAQKVWDEPRKAKVSGFNGKLGMKELFGKDLAGNYGISAVKDSSRPKTQSEKLQAITTAAQSGIVDMQDPVNQDYVLSALNLNDLNKANHYNYAKFDVDLEILKLGQTPSEVPSQKWDIWVKGLGNYQLTEEFRGLDSPIQQGLLMYFQYCSDKLAAITQGVPPDPQLLNKQMAAAMAGGGQPGAGNPLNGVPGASDSPANVEGAAAKQGAQFAQNATPGAA